MEGSSGASCEGERIQVGLDRLKNDMPSSPEGLRQQIQELVLDNTAGLEVQKEDSVPDHTAGLEVKKEDTEKMNGTVVGSGTSTEKSSVSADSNKEKVAECFKKAVDRLQEGYTNDSQCKYRDALKLYKEGIQQLLMCRKYAVLSPESQEKLTAKIKEYLSRAEKITQMLKEGKQSKDDGSENDEDHQSVRLPACVSCERPTLKFSDVVGAEKVKEKFKERVLLPLKFPALFKGSRRIQDAILIHGPPGVGKTMLLRALGGEMDGDLTFIRVSAYDFMSKYEDGEKVMKEVFRYANEHAPSLLVMDDFEAMSNNCGEETGNQRRVKTEFMVQFAGRGKETYVVAATLSPWTIDAALRRRFCVRLFLDMPSLEDRKEIFRKSLLQSNVVPTPEISEEDLEDFATRTEGFTGADVAVVTRDAIMMPVRDIQEAKFFKKIFVEEEDEDLVQIVEKMTPCSHDDDSAEEKRWTDLDENQLFVRPVSKDDVIQALEKSKPTVSEEDIAPFKRFTEDFGTEL